MENLNINHILGRTIIADEIKNILTSMTANKNDLNVKKGIYIYGNPGVGKTYFMENILRNMNYDIIKYDAGDIRNKNIIDTITKHNMSDANVLSLLNKKKQHISIIMDEIDGMNNGDKGGLSSLIKLIRPKKTKKQKLEDISVNPIICIGNYHMDKKIKELIKVCHTYELKAPTSTQIARFLDILTPALDTELKSNLINYVDGDLKKLSSICNIYKQQNSLMRNEIIQNIFQPKVYNEDSKLIAKRLMNNSFNINDHNTLMNETDRTIVGLLWHENIVDTLQKMNCEKSFPYYKTFLENMCFADYIDRITFQKQIWQFNEMSSLVKTMYNNKLFHDTFPKKPVFNPTDVRFTKVLTKYSTEYNNSVFLQNLCDKLQMDKKDLLLYFDDLQKQHSEEDIIQLLETYEITKLDVQRLYRYIDKIKNYGTSEIGDSGDNDASSEA
jgi:SpoVK/Ycf46/Vps4 family AAA+-type ATPase